MKQTGLQYISNGQVWGGERIDGISHPLNISKVWTTSQLAAIGLKPTPAPPTPDPQPVRIGEPWQFIDLFTDAEYADLATKRASNPALDKWLTLALAASAIDLDSPRVVGGMAVLVAEGVITQARSDEILATDFSAGAI